MKKLTLLAAALTLAATAYGGGYVDHRGHNIDSLEVAVAQWTPDKIAKASDAELAHLIKDWQNLALGNNQINSESTRYYARKALKLALAKDWKTNIYYAAKLLGQQHWANERYDSATFYYNLAIDAIERMEVGAVDDEHPKGITQRQIDDGRSMMYGTVGNLYSIQDSTALAMAYYAKAGEIFEKYEWNNSLACLYYNIGETWNEKEELPKAMAAYKKGLDYSIMADDSLWIASNRAGIGSVALKQGKLRKAIKQLDLANQYYTLHQDQEGGAFIDSLDYTNQVLRLQKRQATIGFVASLAALILLIICAIMTWRNHNLKRQKSQTEQVLEETINEIVPAKKPEGIKLNEREHQILALIAEGHTNRQIADEIFLSPETIKWYRKKLLVKFDATNSAELISKAVTRLN